MNHVKLIRGSERQSRRERKNGQGIFYVNDIRFRNHITAIIHRTICLGISFPLSRNRLGMSFSSTNNMKQEALSHHTANRARHWTFIQKEKKMIISGVKAMKHPKKRQVMRKQTRFSIYLTTWNVPDRVLAGIKSIKCVVNVEWGSLRKGKINYRYY